MEWIEPWHVLVGWGVCGLVSIPGWLSMKLPKEEVMVGDVVLPIVAGPVLGIIWILSRPIPWTCDRREQ